MPAKRPPQPLAPADLWDASLGFWRVWSVHLGRRYGLIAALARAPAGLAPAALAKQARVAEGPAATWCEAAAGLGLLERSGGRYRVPGGLKEPLADSTSPDFIGGHFSYIALRSLDFDGFDELFRDGRPSARVQRHLTEAFAQATEWDHTAFLETVPPALPAVRRALTRGGEVLDVGCGAGAWAFRVAGAYPRARIRGVDVDPVPLRRARTRATELGLDGRVSFDLGSAESRAYRERFDLVHLGEVLCGAREDLALLTACRAALKPGGHLVVAEGLTDTRAGPADPGNILVRAMQLEFALQPARFRTREELEDLFGRAGFAPPRILGAGGGFFFAVAPLKRTSSTAGSAKRSRSPR